MAEEITKEQKAESADVAIKNFMSQRGIASRGTAEDAEKARGCSETCGKVCNCYGGGFWATGAGVGGATAGGWSA